MVRLSTMRVTALVVSSVLLAIVITATFFQLVTREALIPEAVLPLLRHALTASVLAVIALTVGIRVMAHVAAVEQRVNRRIDDATEAGFLAVIAYQDDPFHSRIQR